MTPPPPDIQRFALHCDDGVALRAELIAAAEPPRAAVVLCHPHPLHGGNMYSPVIGGLFSGLPPGGVTTLRFNFRGTSGSEGRHDGGRAEKLDVRAAIDHLSSAGDGTGDTAGAGPPIVLVGYSFGALVALSVSHPSIAGWVAIAPPLTMTTAEAMEPAASSACFKHLIVGSEDNFCPPLEVERLTEGWANTAITSLPGEDHFLATAGRTILDTVTSTVLRSWES